MLMNKLFNHCEGLLDPSRPLRENYHPLTGKGLNAENFSWSAAHLLMMIREIEMQKWMNQEMVLADNKSSYLAKTEN